MGEPDFDYFAFISYSHRNSRSARWLHRALETYRLPTGLEQPIAGDSVRRLTPVFRDRDELPAAGDLSATIESAIQRSRFLIVLCSPDAAASKYVNAEIESFRELGRRDAIFALIVDGDPPDCFPSALTDGGSEPIAADARTEGDGKTDAKLKLIAGMLGVGFDTLKRRETRRQRNRLFALAAMACSIAIVMGVLAWDAMQARGLAETRESEAISAKEAAEQAEEEARKTLARSRFIQASDLIAAGDEATAMAILARAIADDPEAKLARMRLHSLLVNGRHALPVAEFQTREVARAFPPQFHPDGQLLFDGERVWDLASREMVKNSADLSWMRIRQLGGPDPERPLMQMIGSLSSLKLVEVGDLNRVTGEFTHEGLIEDYAFSPDGRIVATASADDTGWLWDIVEGRRIGEPMTHRGDVVACEFSPDGEWLATASHDGTVRRWSTSTAEPLGKPLAHGDPVEGVAISPDGSQLASWTTAGEISLWTLEDEERVAQFVAHDAPITSVTYGSTGTALVTTSDDGTARVWDANRYAADSERLLYRPVPHPASVIQADLSPDGKLLSTAAWDGVTRVFALPPIDEPESPRHDRSRLSPEGGYRVLSSLDRLNIDIEPQDGREPFKLEFPAQLMGRDSDWFGEVVFSPDEMLLITLHNDLVARAWHLSKDGAPAFSVGDFTKLRQATFSPDGKRIALLGNGVTVASAEDGEVICRDLDPDVPGYVTGFATDAAFSPSGEILAATFSNGSPLQMWHMPTGDPFGAPIRQAFGKIIFDPKGELLICEAGFGSLKAWHVESGRAASGGIGHDANGVHSLASNGELCAVLSRIHSAVEIYDLGTGRLVSGPWPVDHLSPNSIAIDPAARGVRIRSRTGTPHTIEIDPPAPHAATVQTAEVLAGRRIDPDTGLLKHGINWEELRALAKPTGDVRPTAFAETPFPIIGRWSLEDWIDGQLPPATAKKGFALLEQFGSDPLVNAGMATYFLAAEWSEDVGDKMRALAPDCARMATLNMTLHPLTCYWLALYNAHAGEFGHAVRYIRLCLHERPDDARALELSSQIDEAIRLQSSQD